MQRPGFRQGGSGEQGQQRSAWNVTPEEAYKEAQKAAAFSQGSSRPPAANFSRPPNPSPGYLNEPDARRNSNTHTRWGHTNKAPESAARYGQQPGVRSGGGDGGAQRPPLSAPSAYDHPPPPPRPPNNFLPPAQAPSAGWTHDPRRDPQGYQQSGLASAQADTNRPTPVRLQNSPPSYNYIKAHGDTQGRAQGQGVVQTGPDPHQGNSYHGRRAYDAPNLPPSQARGRVQRTPTPGSEYQAPRPHQLGGPTPQSFDSGAGQAMPWSNVAREALQPQIHAQGRGQLPDRIEGRIGDAPGRSERPSFEAGRATEGGGMPGGPGTMAGALGQSGLLGGLGFVGAQMAAGAALTGPLQGILGSAEKIGYMGSVALPPGGAAAEGDLGEQPLLDELGVSFKDIYQRIRCVFLFQKLSPHCLTDLDLSGPIAILLTLASILLLLGKIQFAYLYALSTCGSLLIWVILNLLSSDNLIDLYNTLSILGYGLLPIIPLALVSVFFPIRKNYWSFALSVASLLWCTLTASRFFQQVSNFQFCINIRCTLVTHKPQYYTTILHHNTTRLFTLIAGSLLERATTSGRISDFVILCHFHPAHRLLVLWQRHSDGSIFKVHHKKKPAQYPHPPLLVPLFGERQGSSFLIINVYT